MAEEKIKLRRSLFIGLGGTGTAAILALKERLLSVYDPINFKTIPPMISFLGIDSDGLKERTSLEGKKISLDPQDYMKVGVNNVNDLLRINQHIRNRIPEEVRKSTRSIHAGCGQIRALGAMTLMAQFGPIREKLIEAVLKIRKWSVTADIDSPFDTDGDNINVYIIFSASGGTGSGMFLDIAFMLRKFCDLDDNDKVLACILLPDTFTHLPGTDNVEPNAYAAFKELDHFMDKEYAEEIKIDYGKDKGGTEIKINRAPFDYVYTINNRNTKGVYYEDVNTLIDFISYALYVFVGTIGSDAASVWDNLEKLVNRTVQVVQGGDHRVMRYLGLGISELYYDGDKVATHGCNLVSNLILKKIESTSSENIQEGIANYIQTNGLNESGPENNEVIDRILKVKHEPIQDVEPDENADTNTKIIKDTYLNKTENKCYEEAKKNTDEFIKLSDANLDSYINSQLEKGNLDYCRKFLEVLKVFTTTISSEMDYEITEFSNNREKIKSRIGGAIEDITHAKEKFIGRKKAIMNAYDACKLYIQQEGDYVQENIRRNEAKRFIAHFKGVITKLEDKLTAISSRIQAASIEVQNEISEIINSRKERKPFSFDLSRELVDKIKIDDPNYSMYLQYLDNENIKISAWHELNTKELIALCHKYAMQLKEIEQYKDLSVEDALLTIDDKKRKSIIRKVDEMSVPVWQYNHAITSSVPTSTIYLIGVANKQKTIFKDDQYGLQDQLGTENRRPAFSTTNDKKRIIMFKTEAAIPGCMIYHFPRYKEKYDYRNDISKRTKQAAINFHAHDGWDRFTELIPGLEIENAMKYYALGFSDPFKLIEKRSGKYWIYTRVDPNDLTKNSKYDGWELISDSRDRIRNFETFQKDSDYIDNLAKLIEKREQEIGGIELFEQMSKYYEKLRNEITRATTADMSEQLAKEAEEIQNYLKDITPDVH